MSYDIYIGNAEIETPDPKYEKEDGEYQPLDWVVPHVTRSDAPQLPYDFMTGNGNSRHPGYSQWADFCEDVELTDLFFNKKTGLMRKHPGTFEITKEHLETIKLAKEKYEKDHPDAIPGWDYDQKWLHDREVDDGVRGRDGILARLIWLEFWFDWALKNCRKPAIYNH